MNQLATERRLFTIGHSNHALASFLALLHQHGIEVLVDVRSQPYSKYVSQFDREPLKAAVSAAGMHYLFLGKELGGRPHGERFYDAEGHVLYGQVACSPLFLQGIERLETGLARFRIALMCSEENPEQCHRFLLVSRVLSERGIAVEHIRGDGQIQAEAELRPEKMAVQGVLFGDMEETTWRSLRPVATPQRPPGSAEP